MTWHNQSIENNRRHLFPALRRLVSTWVALPRHDKKSSDLLREQVREAGGFLQEQLDLWQADIERTNQGIAAATAIAVGKEASRED